MIRSKKIFKFYADILKSEGTEDTDFYVECYASTTALDRQGDIIIADALREASKHLVNVNSTAFYGHNYDLKNAVGRIVESTVDDIGLKLKIFISSWAKELRIKLKEGIISKLSIGGRVIDDETITKDEAIRRGLVDKDCPFDKIHVIKKIELYEVSFVGVPANPGARVLSLVKALENLYKGGEGMGDKEKLEQKQLEQTQEEEEKKDTEEKKEIETKENESKDEEQEKKEEHKQEDSKHEEEKQESEDTGNKDEEENKDLSEEEIKDLLEEKKEEDATKPYYYYYGKDILEKLDKLGEATAEISKKLDDLIKLVKEKVKTIEVVAEKKSVIKKEDIKKEEKKESEEDVDELFLKYIQRK